MVFEQDNPYRSPREMGAGTLRERAVRAGTSSQLLAKGLLYRRVLVEAPVEATIEFKGRSVWRDVIVVDNEIMASHISWWRITPRFQFDLRAGDQVLPVEVRLRIGRFLRIKGFRIKIAGEVVYLEGTL